MATAQAQSTNAKHTTAWRHWISFISLTNDYSKLIKPSELDVCLWLVYLFQKHLSYHTIRSYVYTLAAEIRMRGGANIIIPHESWFLHSTLNYLARELGTNSQINRRPLTVHDLISIFNISDLNDHDTFVFCTMLAVGVFCLLRIGELCFTRMRGQPKFIANKDVTFKGNRIEFTLYNTKTDNKRKGIIKTLTNVKNAPINPFNLVWAIQASKAGRTKGTDPFFTTYSKHPITAPMLIKFLRSKMNIIRPDIQSNEWSGISLRKGGATSAMRANISDSIIEKLGHWKSSAFKTYIAHEPSDIMFAQVQMAHH